MRRVEGTCEPNFDAVYRGGGTSRGVLRWCLVFFCVVYMRLIVVPGMKQTGAVVARIRISSYYGYDRLLEEVLFWERKCVEGANR